MAAKAVVQIVGYKNSGKTTTACELIRRFARIGWRVGSIKHDAHHFEVDYPGKDTWKHREAGASVVAITSKEKTAIMEQRGTSLEELLGRMDGVDVVIVEGYKFENFPKVVLLRSEADFPLVEQTREILALVSRVPLTHPTLPVLPPNDFESLFNLVYQHIQTTPSGTK